MPGLFDTGLTKALGCRYPVIQTAMGWVATAQLVKATTSAGAFGFLAAAVMSPEDCEAEIRSIRSDIAAPFGVNIHSFQPGVDRIIDMCIDYGVAAISYGRAPSARIIEKVKAQGIKCVPTIGAGKHAAKAVQLGADILVCQGAEGGGHTGATPTWLLLSQVLEQDLGVPVVACGGFRDGKGLAAALAYGADGIAMGTRFMMTADSPTPDETKKAYLAADVTRIPVSVKLDGLPQRMVLNEKLAELERASALGLLLRGIHNGLRYRKETGMSLAEMFASAWKMSRTSDLTLGQTMMAANAPVIIQEAMVRGRPERGVLPSGQVAGLINDLPDCQTLITELMTEAGGRLEALCTRRLQETEQG